MSSSIAPPIDRSVLELLDKCHPGDCREVMREWPAAFADVCITDPPYGDTSLSWDKRCIGWVEQAARILKPVASIWVFGSMRYIVTLFDEMEQAGFKYAQDIVWEKQNGSGFQADRFRRVHEHAVQFYRGSWSDVPKFPQYSYDARKKVVCRKTEPAHTGSIDQGHYVSEEGGPRLVRSVIKVANDHGKAVHPTQKPLEILAPLINYSAPPGGIVVDPFYGSGSLGIPANMLGRHFIACENDPACFEMQLERTRQVALPL